MMRFFFFFPVLFFSLCCVGQDSLAFGEYQDAVKRATEYIAMLKQQDKNAIKTSFVETGFQTKKEFATMLTAKNLKWASDVIGQYGMPEYEEIAISVWKVSSKEKSSPAPAINVSFYFKEKGTAHKPINDRISVNLASCAEGYCIDGLLFFKKTDYEAMDRIIKDMP